MSNQECPLSKDFKDRFVLSVIEMYQASCFDPPNLTFEVFNKMTMF